MTVQFCCKKCGTPFSVSEFVYICKTCRGFRLTEQGEASLNEICVKLGVPYTFALHVLEDEIKTVISEVDDGK